MKCYIRNLLPVSIPTGSRRDSVISQSRDSETGYYFAYGSNMNPDRVRQRKMDFQSAQSGLLIGYRLVFNKPSLKHPGAASANLIADQDGRTEGVIYRLSAPDQIGRLDPYEGYPVRYHRLVLPILLGQDQVNAWVYMATPAYITEGLRPARWYLEHLLAGRHFLGKEYIDALATTPCLPNSILEPD